MPQARAALPYAGGHLRAATPALLCAMVVQAWCEVVDLLGGAHNECVALTRTRRASTNAHTNAEKFASIPIRSSCPVTDTVLVRESGKDGNVIDMWWYRLNFPTHERGVANHTSRLETIGGDYEGWYDDLSTPYASARQRCVSDLSPISRSSA